MLADHHCHVLDHRPCGTNLKLLTLRSIGTPFDCKAGQFVMLDLPTRQYFFRRPFSVLNVHGDNVFDIYYKIVGKGTAMMSELVPGDHVKVLGPLGNTFSGIDTPEKTLLVGGGIGIAPLYFMAKHRPNPEGDSPFCFYGVRSSTEIGLLEPLSRVIQPGLLMIATDDGSYGFHGNVCQMLEAQKERLKEVETALLCGPTVMMDAATRWLQANLPGVRIEASLEEHMPCGTGACTGCVIPRTDRALPSKCCVEGPVFDAATVLWPSMGKSQEVPCCP